MSYLRNILRLLVSGGLPLDCRRLSNIMEKNVRFTPRECGFAIAELKRRLRTNKQIHKKHVHYEITRCERIKHLIRTIEFFHGLGEYFSLRECWEFMGDQNRKKCLFVLWVLKQLDIKRDMRGLIVRDYIEDEFRQPKK